MPDLFSTDGRGSEGEPRANTGGTPRLVAVKFRVVGEPQPQGSSRAFIPKGWTRAIITSANPHLAQWRELVAVAAGEAMVGRRSFDGPVLLRAWFYLPRPKSMARKVVQHTKRPDLDKLVRALKDALKAVVWVDDAQVVALEASKHYAVNEPVGVAVEVEAQ